MAILNRHSPCPSCNRAMEVDEHVCLVTDVAVVGCKGCGLYAVEGDDRTFAGPIGRRETGRDFFATVAQWAQHSELQGKIHGRITEMEPDRADTGQE